MTSCSFEHKSRLDLLQQVLLDLQKNISEAQDQRAELLNQLEAVGDPTMSEEECNKILGGNSDDDIECKVATDETTHHFRPSGLEDTLVPKHAVRRSFEKLLHGKEKHVEFALNDQDFLLLSSPQGSLQVELNQVLKDQQFVCVSATVMLLLL